MIIQGTALNTDVAAMVTRVIVAAILLKATHLLNLNLLCAIQEVDAMFSLDLLESITWMMMVLSLIHI